MTTPEAAARGFLDALDRHRWQVAAELVHPETAARFREQALFMARVEKKQPAQRGAALQDLDTRFPGPLEQLGLRSGSELEPLAPRELLVRWMAAVLDEEPISGPGYSRRLRRQLTRCERQGPYVAHCYWRTLDPLRDGEGGPRGEERALRLERTADGWKIRQGELGPDGSYRLMIPDEDWEWLVSTYWSDADRE